MKSTNVRDPLLFTRSSERNRRLITIYRARRASLGLTFGDPRFPAATEGPCTIPIRERLEHQQDRARGEWKDAKEILAVRGTA